MKETNPKSLNIHHQTSSKAYFEKYLAKLAAKIEKNVMSDQINQQPGNDELVNPFEKLSTTDTE